MSENSQNQQLQIKSTRSVIWMSLAICIGACVYGYYSVCVSELATLISQKNNINSQEEFVYELSVTTSLFNFGAFLSPFVYKPFISYFGELKGLLLIDVIGICSIGMQLLHLQLPYLATGRFILGLCMGLSTSIIPVYINSIAPRQISGKIGSFNQLNIVGGIMISYVMGYIIDDQLVADEIRWRILLGAPIIMLMIRIITLQWIYPYNSIQYSIQQNKKEEIMQFCSLVYEGNKQQISQQLIRTKTIHHEKKLHERSWKKRIILAIIVISSNQLSGINGIFFYAKQLFTKITGGQAGLAQTLMLLISMTQVGAVLVGSQIIDRYGRRKIILYGQIILFIALSGIFITEVFVDLINHQLAEVCVIVLLFVHIAAFNVTLGPVCIIYCTEILEDITWIIITLKALSLTMAVISEYMIEYMGIGFMFLLFGVLTFCAFVYLSGNVRETKGVASNLVYGLFADGNFEKEDEQLNLL